MFGHSLLNKFSLAACHGLSKTNERVNQTNSTSLFENRLISRDYKSLNENIFMLSFAKTFN